MTNMTGGKLSICSHPEKITGYWITTRSFPYRGPYWPGPIWALTSSLFQMSEVCNKQFNTLAFPYWLGYHPSTHIGPRLRLWPIQGSRETFSQVYKVSNGVHLSHSRQVTHVYYQLFDSKMADGDQLWSVPKLEYDLLRRNASTNGRKTDLIERYILHRKPKHTIYIR